MELVAPVKLLLGIFPLGALAAVVVWFVYVIKYGHYGNRIGSQSRRNSEQATIAFQGVVASVAVCYALHHHLAHMM